MKKKIGDLTARELWKICNVDHSEVCTCCPLFISKLGSFGKCMSGEFEYFEEEIEVDIDEEVRNENH